MQQDTISFHIGLFSKLVIKGISQNTKKVCLALSSDLLQELEDEIDQANLNLVAFNHVMKHVRKRMAVGCDTEEW